MLECFAFSILLCIFCCDLDNLEIPDELQISLLVVALLTFLCQDANASSKVYGFLIGGGFLGMFSLLYYSIKKREGIGFGDIKLMAILGLLHEVDNYLHRVVNNFWCNNSVNNFIRE